MSDFGTAKLDKIEVAKKVDLPALAVLMVVLARHSGLWMKNSFDAQPMHGCDVFSK